MHLAVSVQFGGDGKHALRKHAKILPFTQTLGLVHPLQPSSPLLDIYTFLCLQLFFISGLPFNCSDIVLHSHHVTCPSPLCFYDIFQQILTFVLLLMMHVLCCSLQKERIRPCIARQLPQDGAAEHKATVRQGRPASLTRCMTIEVQLSLHC